MITIKKDNITALELPEINILLTQLGYSVRLYKSIRYRNNYIIVAVK